MRGNRGGQKMKKISQIKLKGVWNLFTCTDPRIVLIRRINMLPVHYSRLDRDGVLTQTLKSSLQAACTWSCEIKAGVLSGTVKTPVCQQGTGMRQYLDPTMYLKPNIYIFLISYKRSFISVTSDHLQKLHHLTSWVSGSAVAILSSTCLTDIITLWKTCMGFNSSQTTFYFVHLSEGLIDNKKGHISMPVFPDRKKKAPEIGGQTVQSYPFASCPNTTSVLKD